MIVRVRVVESEYTSPTDLVKDIRKALMDDFKNVQVEFLEERIDGSY